MLSFLTTALVLKQGVLEGTRINERVRENWWGLRRTPGQCYRYCQLQKPFQPPLTYTMKQIPHQSVHKTSAIRIIQQWQKLDDYDFYDSKERCLMIQQKLNQCLQLKSGRC